MLLAIITQEQDKARIVLFPLLEYGAADDEWRILNFHITPIPTPIDNVPPLGINLHMLVE
jgi:hypothetical protein